jgi:hypothetical protein
MSWLPYSTYASMNVFSLRSESNVLPCSQTLTAAESYKYFIVKSKSKIEVTGRGGP